jgi:hypothetical protein
MSKFFSRKFILLLVTYAAFVIFFAFGMLSEKWFCGSLLALSLFYYLANVWQKAIENYAPNLDAIIDSIISRIKE